jgi:methionine-rich copper-binding protein CopC
MRALVTRGGLVGLLAMLALMVLVSPAGAHAELESSDPADGATLAEAPSTISFTFGEEILPQGNAVTLTDVAADERLAVGPVEVDGDTVSVAWPESSPAGEFRAAFRVVSADGHPIAGTVTFTVEQAVGADAATDSGPSAAPSTDPSAAPSAAPATASATPSPAGTLVPVTAAETTPVGSDPGLPAWALGVGVAALVAVGITVWATRRSR